MQTTTDFLDAIAERYQASDYRISKMIHASSPSVVYNYRHGRSRFDQATCIKVAELLDLDAGYVLACIEAERASDAAVASVWEKVANTIRATAAAGILGLIALPFPADQAHAQTTVYPSSTAVYYVKYGQSPAYGHHRRSPRTTAPTGRPTRR